MTDDPGLPTSKNESRLLAALQRYGTHADYCAMYKGPIEDGCNCGLFEAMGLAPDGKPLSGDGSQVETKPDEATAAHWLGELLAIIHRDGGQYEAKHGTILATQDAIKIVHVLRGDRNCKVCDGMGYSVGVSKRIPCDECDGTGLALLAEHARPSAQETSPPRITFPEDMPMSERIGDPRIDGKPEKASAEPRDMKLTDKPDCDCTVRTGCMQQEGRECQFAENGKGDV